jgi:hypothetical protein
MKDQPFFRAETILADGSFPDGYDVLKHGRYRPPVITAACLKNEGFDFRDQEHRSATARNLDRMCRSFLAAG